MNLFRKILGLGSKHPINVRPRKEPIQIKVIDEPNLVLTHEKYTEKELLDKIEAFRPENDDFTPLEILFNQLYDKFFKTNPSNKAMVTLFKVLERFNEVSEPHVFWDIMSTIEGVDGFEQEYVNSLKRKASDITMMNLNALFNSDISYVGNEKMEDLLAHIKNNSNTTSSMIRYIKEEFVKIEEE
ncbi:hypothetical protein ACIGCP_11940 [Cellulophaga baltica]|jgi:hypothetical protein|uniref:hypothetical protein n=1 Tax=Cellulophaga TaxID=104264 RepID=UPI001C4E8AF8|nr:hypothetical protein [Cellulophaga sp. HaHa_2_1]QXP51062.1 hypothetical protein H0I24_13010 [Cellulophaga sp. HaHa_2_1]